MARLPSPPTAKNARRQRGVPFDAVTLARISAASLCRSSPAEAATLDPRFQGWASEDMLERRYTLSRQGKPATPLASVRYLTLAAPTAGLASDASTAAGLRCH